MYHNYCFTSLDTLFDFGCHKGETLSDVISREPSYINWCANNIPEFYISDKTILEIKNVFPDFIMSKDFLDRVGDNYERIQTKEERLIEDYFNRFIPYSYIVYEDSLDFDYVEDYMEEEDERTYERYAGSYAQDVMGYSDEDIDTIFDGDPDAYWNID